MKRSQRSPPPGCKLDDVGTYEPYVSVSQRRQAKFAKLYSWGVNVDKDRAEKQVDGLEREDVEREEERHRERERKERTLLIEAQEVHFMKAAEGQFCSCLLATQL
jgi:ATP-dependent RNA helicase DDX41